MKLTIVYEQNDLTIGKDPTGQLYVGGVFEDGTRSYQKIRSYSLKFNGENELDSYVLEDGSVVRLLQENLAEFKFTTSPLE